MNKKLKEHGLGIGSVLELDILCTGYGPYALDETLDILLFFTRKRDDIELIAIDEHVLPIIDCLTIPLIRK